MKTCSGIESEDCFKLISNLSSEEQLHLILSIIDATPDNYLAAFTSSIFHNVFARSIGDANCKKLPDDYPESMIAATAILQQHDVANVLYLLSQAIAADETSQKHLSIQSLSFSIIELITSALHSVDAGNSYHDTDRVLVFLEWLLKGCELASSADQFMEHINKLLFPSEQQKYVIEKDEVTNSNKIVFANIVLDDDYLSADEIGIKREREESTENELSNMASLAGDQEEDSLNQCDMNAQPNIDEVNSQSFNEEPENSCTVLDNNTGEIYEEHFNDEDTNGSGGEVDEDDEYLESCKKKTKANVQKSSKGILKKFSCKKCKKLYFKTKLSLHDHMLKLHSKQDNGKYQCFLCAENEAESSPGEDDGAMNSEQVVCYDSIEELETHLSLHQRMCTICGYVIPEHHTMKSHRHQHTMEEQQMSCPYCELRFSTRWDMRIHMFESHSNVRPFGCKECLLRYATAQSLQEHCDVKHKRLTKTHACARCDKKFDYKCALANHMREVHTGRPEKKFSCDVCSKPFRHELSLQYHRKKAHNIDIKIVHECLHCDKKFPTKHQLLRHKISQHPRAPSIFKCPKCPQKFPARKEMLEHYVAFHEANMQGDVQCQKCDKTFPDQTLLAEHEKLMHIEKEFMCHLCPEVFKTKIGLDSHVNLHSGKKQYLCDICGKGFSTQRNCEKHKMHLHDKTLDERRAYYAKKSVSCSECGKRFGCQRNLTIHEERIHRGNKMYAAHECEFCGGYFSAKIALQKHIETQHQGIKRPAVAAKCDICPKTFSSTSTLKWHKQQAHSIGCTPHQCAICRNYYDTDEALQSHYANNKHANRQPGRSNKRARTTGNELQRNLFDVEQDKVILVEEEQEVTYSVPGESLIDVKEVTTAMKLDDNTFNDNTILLSEGNSLMIEETGETITLPPGTKFIQLGDQILEIMNN